VVIVCFSLTSLVNNDEVSDRMVMYDVTFCMFDYHRRAVAQPCVNGDQRSQWRMAKFDSSQIQAPSTDRHKIETGDYVHETTPVQNFVQIHLFRASEQRGEI